MTLLHTHFTLAVLGAAALCSVTPTAGAQRPFEVPREIVDFVIVDLATPYSSAPYSETSGTVWTAKIRHAASTAAIRLHVKAKQTGPVPIYEILVKDPDNQEIERIPGNSPLVAAEGFWTTPIPGTSATIQLVVHGDPSHLEILVDRYAYAVANAKPESTHGSDDKVAIAAAPPEVRALAPPIARLVIMAPRGGYYCTGFLVTDTLLFTNEHCIQNPEEARSTVAEFAYEGSQPRPTSFRVVSLEAVDEGLDYALVRLAGSPGRQFKRVSLGGAQVLLQGMGLVVIQHPAGFSKMAAVANCKVDGVVRTGVGGGATDFGHICDTLGGSSGSPVFSAQTKQVVGLHHLGFEEGIPTPVNQAVQIGKVLADVKRQNARAHGEIVAALADENRIAAVP